MQLAGSCCPHPQLNVFISVVLTEASIGPPFLTFLLFGGRVWVCSLVITRYYASASRNTSCLVLETLGTTGTSVLGASTSPRLCFRAHLSGWTTRYRRTLPIYIDKYGGPRVEISSFSLLALTLPPFGVLSQAVARVAFGDISITDSYKYSFNRTK